MISNFKPIQGFNQSITFYFKAIIWIFVLLLSFLGNLKKSIFPPISNFFFLRKKNILIMLKTKAWW